MPLTLVTSVGHVKMAIAYYDSATEFFFCIGRTTPWPDEGAPPTPSESATDVEEIIGYRAADSVVFVVPDPAGTISYRGQNYREVSRADALAQGARHLYFTALLTDTELPLQTYRQIGLYKGLVRAGGVPGDKKNLLPSEVLNNGDLEVIANRVKVVRQAGQQERLSALIEF